ncbi:MAG: hypothetical protein ACREBF_03180 [Candidatus Micrarchaeales archaeon]
MTPLSASVYGPYGAGQSTNIANLAISNITATVHNNTFTSPQAWLRENESIYGPYGVGQSTNLAGVSIYNITATASNGALVNPQVFLSESQTTTTTASTTSTITTTSTSTSTQTTTASSTSVSTTTAPTTTITSSTTTVPQGTLTCSLSYQKMYIGQNMSCGGFTINLQNLGYSGGTPGTSIAVYKSGSLQELLDISQDGSSLSLADSTSYLRINVSGISVNYYSSQSWAEVSATTYSATTSITTSITTTTASTTSTISRTNSSTTTIPQSGVATNFKINATDPQDGVSRYWEVFTTYPGAYLGYGTYANSTSLLKVGYYNSGGIMTFSESYNGLYDLYFVITQSGGGSHGTYSGQVAINNNSDVVGFTGVDQYHALRISMSGSHALGSSVVSLLQSTATTTTATTTYTNATKNINTTRNTNTSRNTLITNTISSTNIISTNRSTTTIKQYANQTVASTNSITQKNTITNPAANTSTTKVSTTTPTTTTEQSGPVPISSGHTTSPAASITAPEQTTATSTGLISSILNGIRGLFGGIPTTPTTAVTANKTVVTGSATVVVQNASTSSPAIASTATSNQENQSTVKSTSTIESGIVTQIDNFINSIFPTRSSS